MPSEDEEDLAAFLDAIQPVQAPTPVAVTPATTAAEESDDALEDLLPSIQEPARPRTAAVVEDDEDGDDISDFVSSVGITSERDVPDITKPWMKYHKFVRVTTVEELDRIVDEALAHGRCALDLETEGLDNRIVFTEAGPKTVHQIVGFCLSMDGLTGYYAPVRHKATDGGPDLNVPVAGAEAAIRRLCLASQPVGVEEAVAKDPLSFKDFVSAPKVILYFFNAQFDQEFLYPVTGIDWWHPDSFEDGILAGFARHAADKALGLKHKAQEFLRDKDGNRYVMIELKELFIRGRPVKFDHLSPDEPGVIKYACSDAICTYLLCEHPDLMKLVKDKYLFTYRLEKQVSQVVRVMERNRVRIDRDTVREILKVNETERNRILGEIRSFAEQKGFHNLEPSSTKQLGQFLFEDGPGCMNISPKPERNEKSGQFKTDAETLETMVADNPHAPPVLKWVVEYRQVEKIIGTYLLALANNPDANSELRFSFKQTGAGTGRFSAPANADKIDHGFSGVPVHGIPGESTMRKVFIAREGYTYAKCDYAGQELRIASNVSGEPVWVKEFLEGSGDLHSITARAFFNKQEVTKDERSKGKTANFALIYGGGPQAIIRATGCDKLEASRRKQSFDKAVPTFAKWIKSQHISVKRDLGVWTSFGRWLAIPDANINTGIPEKDKAVRAACERYSTNYPIQGSGADIMKISMVLLHKEFHKRGWLRNGGDDSVRMLMTVHDELVFEIRHARVVEAIPLIVKVMESPTLMAKPRWQVPLIVEPLIGPNWGSGYKCERVKPGHKAGEGEVIVNGYLYGTIRKAEKGDLVGLGEVEEGEGDKRKLRIVDPPWLRGVVPDNPEATSTPVVAEAKATSTVPASPSPTSAPATVAKPPSTPPQKSNGSIVTLKICRLNRQTVDQVFMAVWKTKDSAGKSLRLTDGNGAVLVDPSLGVKVDPDKLSSELFELNLGDGSYGED